LIEYLIRESASYGVLRRLLVACDTVGALVLPLSVAKSVSLDISRPAQDSENMFCNAIKFVFKLAYAIVYTATIAILAIPAIFIPPPPTLSGCPERLVVLPPDFNQCKRLQDLIQKIQNHISESTSTRRCYAAICEDIERELQDDPGSNITHFSEESVKDQFSSNWPQFVPLNPGYMKYKDEIHWGRVEKDLGAPNEIELCPDLVRAVEAAPLVSNEYSSLSLVFLCHCIWPILFLGL
jgi:hypothetical protein